MIAVAAEYGVGWDTVMSAVVRHGTPLVDNPRRVGVVRTLDVDEHSYLAATPAHQTIYATSLVDLDHRRVIDLFDGKTAQGAPLRRRSDVNETDPILAPYYGISTRDQ